MEEKEVIAILQKYGVEEILFDFYCGGDSMGDTEWIMPEELPENEWSAIELFLDEEVYNRVEFYVNSDGHYQGESGNVTVMIEDDILTYSKSAQSEWSESKEDKFTVEVTDDEKEFIVDKVNLISGNQEEVEVNYKKDFIMTDELLALVESVKNKLKKEFTKVFFATPEIEYEEDSTFDTSEGWNDENPSVEFYENEMTVTHNYRVTEYRDSE